jgi:outer membrane protein
MSYYKSKLFPLLFLLIVSNGSVAQNDTSHVSLKAAIQLSNEQFHSLKSRQYQAQSALKNVDVTRHNKMPALDASYQLNLATANNVTGMFYPSGILPISGPPSLNNNFSPVTGSAASILLNWQAITFGQLDAQINVSKAEAESQKLALEKERFNNYINVISKYLDVLLFYERVRIQERNMQRVQVNLNQSKVLSNAGLRPGVDTALFLSEVSKSSIERLNAMQQFKIQQLQLAHLMVIDLLPVPTDTSFLQTLPPLRIDSAIAFTTHPLMKSVQGELEISHAKIQLLNRSYFPKLTVFGIAFARGSGVGMNAETKTLNGLVLNRYNYGAGVQLAFPIMKYGEVKRQLQVQNLLLQASSETVMETNSQLITEQRIAKATFESSVAVANETEKQLKSAHYAFNAMQTRYSTGLATLSDLVQVQYNLLQAELDVRNAYWNGWKALLLLAAVKGDINYFLNEIK